MSVSEHAIVPVMLMGQSIVFLVVGQQHIYMNFFAKGAKMGKATIGEVKAMRRAMWGSISIACASVLVLILKLWR